ncbi:MAG: hypothetical protein JXA54_01010 [Candidatus Heimdallarchaeota archaeon]|nr:hypothetical protein [Candidatus Heimdallarchaeota archaeon]
MAQKKRVNVHLKSILNNLSIYAIYGRIVKDTQYLISLQYNMKAIGWDDIMFFPDGFAGNPSFLYLIFKILYREKPKRILELGSGQSTLFTSRYVKENGDAQLVILEDYKDWYDKLKTQIFMNERVRYLYSPLQEIRIRKKQFKWYSADFLLTEELKYNLIIVDGPIGTHRNSRIGIVKFLPKILDPENFILIFDDSCRKGEIDTIKLTKKILLKNNIQFVKFNVHGCKRQTVFASKNMDYMEFNWTLF